MAWPATSVVALTACSRRTAAAAPRCSGNLPPLASCSIVRRRYFHSTGAASYSPSARASPSSPPSGPTARYNELVQKGLLKDDDHQRSIIAILQGLHEELTLYRPPNPTRPLGQKKEVEKRGFFGRLFGSSSHEGSDGHDDGKLQVPEDVPKGLYLHGDVGTGKSMLMDLFFDTLPDNITHKRRIHFHQFMIDAHKRMHAFKTLTHKPSGIVVGASSRVMSGAANAISGGPAGGAKERAAAAAAAGEDVDPIPPVAMEFAQEATVLCFDEFQVTDIADAMILRRLLEHMIAHGVVFVMTSNREPKDLYKNGIQRSSFVPCIELLQSQLKVQDLNSGTDYRKVPKALSKVYYAPLDDKNLREFEKLFEAFTSDPHDPAIEGRPLTIWGRTLAVPLSTKKVARFSFHDLCGTPRSAADYIEICQTFPTVFVDEVPKMGLDQREMARRFITFIDAAYESKTKLFASSEVPILQIFGAGTDGNKKAETSDAMREAMDALGMTMDQLGGNPIFSGDEELFAFARVISRLTEMGTTQYAELAGVGSKEAPPEM
ncbi:hypothetical protein BDZ90DRAFT_58781 [Jaminaea rosea]|uniref:AFG1-like ATPase n=1 Tax=Jaminaea rosea TaxID=1569628 RepID=A0A316UP27_9BASI|nr:hypothetical protein BDZ90DRAFT_58781 [Jaminaea rosea]PWN26101.1 hypothetical protein BDZ90DRAFT_58781 [Jaminaea rosea]